MQPADLDRTLRLLAPGGWVASARRFATSLRTAGHEPGRLLVVGTPEEEPWHLAAHLDDAARWRALPDLRPSLVRWHVPPGAPPHLAVGIDAVHRAGRGATVLVAAPGAVGDPLLERLDDARRGGATLFGLHPGDDPLRDLLHESLPLPRLPGVDLPGLDTASHVVTSLASEPPHRIRTRWLRRSRPGVAGNPARTHPSG